MGKHRPYIDANKLANVIRDIMNKKRLTEAEIQEIKKTVRKQTKQKNQNLKCSYKYGELNFRTDRKYN